MGALGYFVNRCIDIPLPPSFSLQVDLHVMCSAVHLQLHRFKTAS